MSKKKQLIAKGNINYHEDFQRMIKEYFESHGIYFDEWEIVEEPDNILAEFHFKSDGIFK